MFAGKTITLIRRVKGLEYLGKRGVAIKPVIDNRYSETAIVSHDGKRLEAKVLVHDTNDLPDYLLQNIDFLAIDEFQFFTGRFPYMLLPLLAEGVIRKMMIAGLDTDWQGVPFGPMPYFLAFADDVTKLHARCAVCGGTATRSHLLNAPGAGETTQDTQVIIGGEEQYEPRCLSCFMHAQKARMIAKLAVDSTPEPVVLSA